MDSYYDGYSLEPLVDSFIYTKGLKYNKSSWASNEEEETHFIEIKFRDMTKINTIYVFWALDKENYFVSKDIRLKDILNNKI